jgi:transposase
MESIPRQYCGKQPVKTVKIAVKLTEEQEKGFEVYRKELTWVWNFALSTELHNHCIAWYSWAEKFEANPRLYSTLFGVKPGTEISLEGVVRTPLRFRKNAFMYAASQIAHGGRYAKIDYDAKADIEVKERGSIKYNKPFRWYNGDHPYTRITPIAHEFRSAPNGHVFKNIQDIDRMAALNSQRIKDLWPALTVSSDYVAGLLNHLKVAIAAWKNPALKTRKKPLFKKDGNLVTALSDPSSPNIKFNHESKQVTIRQFVLAIADKSYRRRLELGEMEPRTYTLTKSPSGYYLNVVITDRWKAEIPTLNRRKQSAKKMHGQDSVEYQEAKDAIEAAKAKSIGLCSAKRPTPSAGIDPGVSAVIATDHGALFQPSTGRERISIHIEKLQADLDRLKAVNDAAWTASGGKGARRKTKNEEKLAMRIARCHEKGANNVKHFNHKLSTRLVRTYGTIAWEDTNLLNMLKQAEPLPSPNDTGYLPNGAGGRRDLNWRVRQRALGNLKDGVVRKIKHTGGNFVESPANYSTQRCHCCGEIGKVIGQPLFLCGNEKCEKFEVHQNADVNAAKSFKLHSGLELGEDKYFLPKLDVAKSNQVRHKSKS